MTWVIVIIAICVLIEGLSSGSEIGFYSVNRLRLRSRLEAEWRGAGSLKKLMDRPDEAIMTTLIVTNLMVYMASSLATELLSATHRPELYATAIMTPVIFVFGEMLPKDLFRRHADVLMYRLAGPIDALRTLFWPVIFVLQLITDLATRRLPRERRALPLTRTALAEWIAEGRREGQLSEYQQVLSSNVMALLRKNVSVAMIPIDEVDMVSAERVGEELGRALRRAKHSRLPVYEGDRENVVGVLHTLDYICARTEDRSARDLARKPVVVPQADGVQAALVKLQKQRQLMAIVADDEGRSRGVITMKDLVEEIVGELEEF